MRVLVLGSRGFIGSRLLATIGDRYSVVGADIDRSGPPNYVRIDPNEPDFDLLVESTGPDVIINCSGAASVPASFEAPFRDFTLNTLRMAQLLEAIRVSKKRSRLIHLSSAAVYGNPHRLPVLETDTTAPISPYGWHKWHAELICRQYSRLHSVETISLRIFSVYGPCLRKQLFWDVFQKSLRGPRVKLFGTGGEMRDFIYVDDLAGAIDCVIRRAEFDGRAVNAASGVAVTIREAATTLLNKLGTGCTVVFDGASRRGDPDRWQADVSYLRSLGFTPTHDIETGLDRTAQWLSAQQ